MKAVLVSNLFSNHMLPLSFSLQKLCDSFDFIVTEETSNIGFLQSSQADFVTYYYKDEEREIAKQKIIDADFVIFGSCPQELLELRMNENKLSFLYSERFFKKGVWRRFIPRTVKAIYNRSIKFKNKNFFVLCASAYLSYDLSLLGFPVSKCFKWGYFPVCDCIDSDEINKKRENTILWAGRFLKWKHPEVAVLVAHMLKKNGIRFQMNIVGAGPEKRHLERLISKYNLNENVRTLGSKSHDDLMELMREHRIYMFTSDFYEGWGAVLNEAMASGCAVVASHAIGSVPFLLKDGENGRIYRYGSIDEAYRIVAKLLRSPDLCAEYGKKAISTVKNDFSCEVAAKRICSFAKAFINGEELPHFESGVMSSAEVLKNNWKD